MFYNELNVQQSGTEIACKKTCDLKKCTFLIVVFLVLFLVIYLEFILKSV